MSKNLLKKELVTFTNEQLVEVILNAYDSSKEAKNYFEFFLNPDAEALLEKKTDIIAKELTRSKRGYCKGKISLIRNTIKGFEAYGVGPEYVGRLMLATIRMLTGQYRCLNYAEPLLNGTYRMVADYIAYANQHGFVTEALAEINKISRTDGFSTAQMRERIASIAAKTVEELNTV